MYMCSLNVSSKKLPWTTPPYMIFGWCNKHGDEINRFPCVRVCFMGAGVCVLQAEELARGRVRAVLSQAANQTKTLLPAARHRTLFT